MTDGSKDRQLRMITYGLFRNFISWMKILQGLKVPVMTLNRAPSRLVTWVAAPPTDAAVRTLLSERSWSAFLSP